MMASSLGFLLMNATWVEFMTIRWVDRFSPGRKDRDRAIKQRFEQRVDSIIEFVGKSEWSDEIKSAASSEWKEVKQLFEFRNKVAHNPIARHNVEDELVFVVCLMRRSRGGNKLFVEEITQGDLEDAANRLAFLCGSLNARLGDGKKKG